MMSAANENAERRIVTIVDDDPTSRLILRGWLRSLGYEVREYATAAALLADGVRDCATVCVDLGLDDMPGLELVRLLHAENAYVPIVVVTAQVNVDTAVQAMQAGAQDYVTKPLDLGRVSHAVAKAIERLDLMRRVQSLENALASQALPSSLIGASPVMQELSRQIQRVVDSDVIVCILGESGTGKELVARAIHDGGPRKTGPFVALNCAAIPESLQESELFGHERGAFTGAVQARRGRFEQANGGTLFLDELGEMSMATQAALLRTIQERTIRRVGGTTDLPITARIVCATHRDLRAQVAANRFREDLYFRLVVYPIRVPPLRERLSDIPLLVAHFLQVLAPDLDRQVDRVSAEVLDGLTRYSWPGNVRELQNVVHRGMLSCHGREIQLSDLPAEVRALAVPSRATPGQQSASVAPKAGARNVVASAANSTAPPHHAGSASAERSARQPRPKGGEPKLVDADGKISEAPSVVPLRDLEERAIAQALKKTNGNVAKAAKLLGVGRATLYRRLAGPGKVEHS